MKAITLATVLALLATSASAFSTTRCSTFGGTTTCTTIGGGTYSTTRCTMWGGVLRCTSY